jgi:Tfp pilus assembly protein PilO
MIAVLLPQVPPVPPIPPIPQTPGPIIVDTGMVPPWITLPPGIVALISLGFFAATAFVLYPLMRAISRRIEGRSQAADPALLAELDQLRHRVADLESMQQRMAELEERVDFSERLLSQQRDANRLPGAR